MCRHTFGDCHSWKDVWGLSEGLDPLGDVRCVWYLALDEGSRQEWARGRMEQ